MSNRPGGCVSSLHSSTGRQHVDPYAPLPKGLHLMRNVGLLSLAMLGSEICLGFGMVTCDTKGMHGFPLMLQQRLE